MSSASTPRSTRSPSPANNSPNMLTPGQKIKAMMAEFDSDSESDFQATKKKTTIPKLDFGRNNTSTTTERRPLQSNNDSSDDSDDADDIVRPQGRMAARMQGSTNESSEQGSAFSRLSNALRSEKEQAQKPREKSPASVHESSDDDLPVTGSKKRNNAQVQRSSTTGDSPTHSRTDSPLFVSSPAATRPQSESRSDKASGSDSEAPSKAKNARFLELIAQKRKERQERERVEAEEKAARRAKMEQFSSDILSGEESGADDPGSAHKLSQKARQPRKASKKALEEMSRETQRMSRNMQLAHQAQTKKKITKESLFARFNFMQADPPPAEPAAANSSSAAGSQNSSDIEGQKNETPRTSPVLGPADGEKPTEMPADGQPEAVHEQADIEMTDLPTLEEAIADTPIEPKDTDALVAPVPEVIAKSPGSIVQPKEAIRKITPPSVRVLMSRQEVAQHQHDGSDSDELEVITSPAKCRRIAAFENLPSRQMQESSSMTKLKALAHLTSPNHKMSSMSSAELSASLLYKARQQAAKDRRERIEELRAKGVVIETAEERAAMEDNVEDLVEKARQEADEIAREERAARRKAKGLDADDDEEDDDDYAFSGSDDDASGDDEDEDEEKSAKGEMSMFEREADEADESSGDESEAAVSEPEIEAPGSRRKRRTRVVSDDEDDEENEQQIPSTPVRPPSHVPQSAERPKFPGMETPDMSMGLTQAFAGTLADENASQPGTGTIPFSLPDPGRPVPRLRAEESEILVKDSQEQNETDFMPAYNTNVNRVSESPAGHGFSEFSQIPDPTQDEGFVFSPFDPSKRFRGTPPVSTIDTVIVGQSQSPVAERKGRKIRRGRAANLSAVEEQNEDEGEFEINANAFNVMKKAAKKTTTPYDKKNSKAKGVVDEAAEESGDEYAGIGGASDDSDGEEDIRDLNMINDNSGEVVDEKELAALNASHQRNRDEKDVAKLLKDISTGALRRRRGGDDDLDLDDSDDERVARRREKQREFAKMRRALLADDKVGALAENPKKAAFFKAIEDREDQDDFELEFLEEKDGASLGESSQDVAADQQPDAGDDSKKRKRPLEPSTEDATNRPPPHLRRTAASAMSKKPATLAEVRETLSFLTETHEYDSFHEDASIDGDEEPGEEADNNTSGNDEAYSEDAQSQPKETFAKPSHPRRTRGTVIDRLALLRQASSNSATTTASGSTNNKMAFHGGGNSDGPIGFRPPQLLRRVTSGSSSSNSTTSNSSSRIPTAASGPKKGGAVNSYTAAREQERERQLRSKQRNGGSNIAKLLSKHAGGGLGSLAGNGQWD